MFKLVFRGLQLYFEIVFSLWKGCTRFIRVLLLLLIFPTLLLVTLLTLLATLVTVTLFCDFCFTLSPTYRFRIRLATFVEVVQVFSIWSFSNIEGVCVVILAVFGGGFLLLSSSLSVLLTRLLSFNMLLLFPEKRLPFPACFFFCYYLLYSNHSSFTGTMISPLSSLTVSRNMVDHTSHAEVHLNTTINPSYDKHNGGVRGENPEGDF